MADARDKALAEATLNRLLVGASINGLRFGVIQLLFDPVVEISGEPYVLLGSAWELYPRRPKNFPESESDIVESSTDEEIQRAISLRQKVVSSVEILTPWPHLILTFNDGSVLYLNGKNDQYEPWTAGLAHTPIHEMVQVIACPGGGLAFVLPDNDLSLKR